MNNDVELIPVKGVLPSVQVQSDNVIYVPQAHKNKAGIVKEGDGVLIENGVVSLNKQTVEDMIDANKWVSYGFQQNLTEDEKGMARHNIGAGDNDFTGSWYDLANRPQETVDFAESERQKSKNLFPYSTITGTDFYQQHLNTPIKAGTYTISALVSSSDTDSDLSSIVFENEDKSYIITVDLSRNSRSSATFTINHDCSYVTFFASYQYTVSVGDTFTFSNIQIEEGSVATSYQPYNGQITHNGDAPVTFAESERQKSKNLCCLKNESATVAGVTMIYDSINQTIELNGTSTGDINIMPNIRNILPIISNSLGKTYSFTILIESGNFSNNFGVYLGSLDSDIWSDRFTIWVNKGITVSSLTFTVSTNHTYDTLFVYLLKGTVVNNLKLKVQIEEGSVATDYQPYNGAIVHNNELLNKVYPIGSIYLSVNDTSPASIFGGTWEKIQNKFLLGSGSYLLGSEGGSTSHNHSLNNGFAKIGYTWASGTENSLYFKYKPISFVADIQTTNDTGYQQTEIQRDAATELGGTTDNTEILPPYLVVNIWKRIA